VKLLHIFNKLGRASTVMISQDLTTGNIGTGNIGAISQDVWHLNVWHSW